MWMSKKKDFNRGNRPRRSWQSGDNPGDARRFTFQVPMFIRRTQQNQKLASEPPYPLHPWVSTALLTTDEWVPNPERPRILAYEDGQLKSIADSNPPRLEKGDIVWTSYTVTFKIGHLNWGPDFYPIDIIRVGKMSGPSGIQPDYSGYIGDEVYRQRLAVGSFVQPSEGM